MFKSDKVYEGLDDYFQTAANQDHVRRNVHIAERIAQINSIYEGWSYDPFWVHDKDQSSNRWKNAFCREAIALMEEAANSYILGLFKASTAMSSAAVEQLTHIDITLNAEDAKRVQRADGSEYLIFDYGSLGGNLFCLQKHGYPTKLLLDSEETNLQTCIFVQRRNTIVHGAHTNEFVVEQMHYLNIMDSLADKSNAEYLYFNSKSAFDQYEKATKFIIATFKWFDKERKPAKPA